MARALPQPQGAALPQRKPGADSTGAMPSTQTRTRSVPGGGGAGSGKANDPDVVDAEFTEVKDKK